MHRVVEAQQARAEKETVRVCKYLLCNKNTYVRLQGRAGSLPMSINATLGEYGARQLKFTDGPAPLCGLEIWNVEVSLSIVNNNSTG
jgi:hypothetical protein